MSSEAVTEDRREVVEDKKRNAVRNLIQRYYCQLTQGCGSSDCTNEHCASCPQFRYPNLDANNAASMAIKMLQEHVQLCECPRSKKSIDKIDDDVETKVQLSDSVLSEEKQSKPAEETVTVPAAAVCINQEASQTKTSCEFLTEKRLLETIKACQETGSWSDLNQALGVFFNPDCLMRSFLLEKQPSKEQLRSAECDKDIDEQEPCARDSEACEASSSCIKSDDNESSTEVALHLDIDAVRRVFNELYSLDELPFQTTLVNAVFHLARQLESDLRSARSVCSEPDYINLFLIIMEIPSLDSPEFIEAAMPQFCKAVGLLKDNLQLQLTRVWSRFSADELQLLVRRVQQLITIRVVTTEWSSESRKLVHDDDAITGAVKLLKLLYYASAIGGCWDSSSSSLAVTESSDDLGLSQSDELAELEELFMFGARFERKPRHGLWDDTTIWSGDKLGKLLNINPMDCQDPLVPADEFVNEALSDVIEMDKDFLNYKMVLEGETSFAFMFHPYVLTTASKQLALYFDNRIRMMNERRSAIFQGLMFSGQITPYLRLRIRRDHVVEDALVNLEMVTMDNPQDLKKQLFVEFEGEQGIDEGGPSKEFFQLIVEELFNPDIGMFVFSEETQNFWFNCSSFETDAQYQLIGIILGLAIYNSVILDVHLPMVVYKKLMGQRGTFQDLKASHPTLGRTLQDLLDYEGDVAEAFMQPFCIADVDVFGNPRVHNLRENGDQILVTNETRQEFVQLYTDFLLNISVEKQFSAFQRGFRMVTSESPLRLLFRPDEIELLVCGSRHYDFEDLEKSTEYDGGFTADSPTVRYFWETVHEFTDDQKCRLLQFATGSDRAPIGGLSKLKLVIARNGPDTDRCPTAHTCFNVLLLPEYATKEKLRDRLLKAITYSKGFGML